MVRPAPSAMGLTTIWYSSISFSEASWETTLPLPMSTRPSPDSCFSFRTSAARSPFISLVFCHDTLSSVLENTTLGSLFICAATSGNCWAAIGVGHQPAIIS
jgi:hypothetical protein